MKSIWFYILGLIFAESPYLWTTDKGIWDWEWWANVIIMVIGVTIIYQHGKAEGKYEIKSSKG